MIVDLKGIQFEKKIYLAPNELAVGFGVAPGEVTGTRSCPDIFIHRNDKIKVKAHTLLE